MRQRVMLGTTLAAGILACALLVHLLAALASGAAPDLPLFSAFILLSGFCLAGMRKLKGHEIPPQRTAVRLALRLAGMGQRTVLVESEAGVRVMRFEEAARGPRLKLVGARAGGALILARRA